MATLSSAVAQASDFSYSACYCEENVYLLCKRLAQRGIAAHDASDLYVVFISNANKQVPIWCQKAGSVEEDSLVIWDYHVICIQTKNGSEARVWDLDTTLGFPETFSQYSKKAFRPWVELCPAFQRLYRVVAGPLFLQHFASDRRHMRKRDGGWKVPPPPYDCIYAQDGTTHNLEEYMDISKETVLLNGTSYEGLLRIEPFGAVLKQSRLLDFFVGQTTMENSLLLQA